MPDYKVFTFAHDRSEEDAFYSAAKDYGIGIVEVKKYNGFGDLEWIVEARDADTFLDWYFDTGDQWAAKDYLGGSNQKPKEV